MGNRIYLFHIWKKAKLPSKHIIWTISYISKLQSIPMSSKKKNEPRTHGAPYYVQKIDLGLGNNNRRTRKKPLKLCPDWNDCIKLFSNNVNRIEDTINNFYKKLPKKKAESNFNIKFTLNSIPCELEYDLSKFTFENLQKLVIFTTQNCNNKSDKNNKNDKEPKEKD